MCSDEDYRINSFWDEVDCNLFAFFSDDTLRQNFSHFGQIYDIKIFPEKFYGFIKWVGLEYWTMHIHVHQPCSFLAQNKNKSKGILLITVRQPVIRGSLLRCYFCGWDALWRASPCGKGTKLIGTNTLTVGEGFIVNMHLIPPANFTFQLHSTDFTRMTKH